MTEIVNKNNFDDSDDIYEYFSLKFSEDIIDLFLKADDSTINLKLHESPSKVNTASGISFFIIVLIISLSTDSCIPCIGYPPI